MRRPASGLLAVLAAVILAVTWQGFPPASAAEPPRSEFVLDKLGLGDQTAQGAAPVLTFFFPGPGDHRLEPSGSVLRLVYSHSPLLLERHSTMTVQVNDSDLTAVWLGPDNAGRTVLEVPVPGELILPGTNVVRLKFHMKLRDTCEDPRNPALFTRIHKESGMRYQYAAGYPLKDPTNLTLSRFPYPFARDGYTRSGGTVVILPAAPTQPELSAAATIAATMGRYASTENLKLSVLHADRFAAEEHGRGNDLILIGTAARNPLTTVLQQLRGMVPPETAVGSLRLAQSFADPQRVALMVTGDTDEAVLQAAVALADERARASFGGDAAVVRDVDARLVAAPSQYEESRRTFQELGQESYTVTGQRPGMLRLNFLAPALTGEGDARLKLWLGHSSVMDEKRSHLRVALNGTAVTSVALTERNRERSAVDIGLPSRALRPGVNTLTVEFNLHLQADENRGDVCTEDTSDRAWVSIFGDSSISTGPGGSGAPNVETYPYPFVHPGGMSGTMLVTGTDTGSLQTALLVAAQLGRANTAPTNALGMSAPDQLTDEQRAGSMLLAVGRPSRNPFVASLSESLPLRFQSDADRLVQEKGAVLAAVRGEGDVGVFEVVPSPYAASRWLGVIAATTPKGMEYVLKMLEGRRERGNVLIATSAEEPAVLELAARERAPVEVHKKRAQRGFLPLLTVAVAIVTVGLVGWRVFLTARRTREARI
jgi:hypothetical protein